MAPEEEDILQDYTALAERLDARVIKFMHWAPDSNRLPGLINLVQTRLRSITFLQPSPLLCRIRVNPRYFTQI